jgi:signal transduction histidine kinase/CheY-like chemotaxis protein
MLEYARVNLGKRLGLQHARPRRHRRKDGTIIDVEVTSDDLVLHGRECRVCLCQDVMERNRASAELALARDEAVEASNMKSAFLANMSHEIRTPMNGVIGMTELLLDMDLTDGQRECAEQIARSGEQMLAIINDILDISKIETGHLELDINDFDLHETIDGTCSFAGAQARAKGLRLEVQIGSDVPRRVRGDGRRLHQVVLNLVSNAIKFTSTGGVSVLPTAGEGGAMIRVAVADSGIGIDPSNLQRMFEPFTQADVSTTRLYGGTGLGLAIARELVELMGGTITAESELGVGSTFSFELALAPAQAGDEALPARAAGVLAAAPAAWASAPLVLVAEDSQVNQIVAARTLERCGCRVDVVADGRAALEALAKQHYDAVLMDCQMPDMDGYQATAELRRRERAADGHTPVIAMTAQAMDGDRERCIDAGMDDFISKPMRHQDLADTLRRLIPSHSVTSSELSAAPASAEGSALRRRSA